MSRISLRRERSVHRLWLRVNSDASVRLLGKGDDRPVNPQGDRAAMLAALESVSLVTLFDERVPAAPLEIVRPEIFVKGGDYDLAAIPEVKLVEKWGGKAISIEFDHDRSTTSLLARLRGQI